MDSVIVREARAEDMEAIVGLYLEDPVSRARERPGDPAYAEAMGAILADAHNALLVAEADDGAGGLVVGALQLTFIPSLTRVGSWRGQAEGVHVREGWRGRGIGWAMMLEAERRAEARGRRIMQLTTDKRRTEAKRFYEGLGYEATHEGMKRALGARERGRA